MKEVYNVITVTTSLLRSTRICYMYKPVCDDQAQPLLRGGACTLKTYDEARGLDEDRAKKKGEQKKDTKIHSKNYSNILKGKKYHF